MQITKKSNKIIYLTGSVCYAIIQWILLTTIAKSHSLEYAGGYIYITSIITPIFIISNLGLRNGIASDKNREFRDGDYINTKILLSFIFLLSGAIIVAQQDKYIHIAIFVISIKLFESISDLIYGSWNRSGSFQKYGISQIIKLASISVLTLLTALKIINIEIFLIGVSATILTILLFYELKECELKHSTTNLNTIKNLIAINFPLGLSALVAATNSSAPRIIIGNINGEKSLAIYTILTYFIIINQIPITSISQIIIKNITEKKDSYERKNYFSRVCIYSAAYSLISTFVLILFGTKILNFIYEIRINNWIISFLLISLTSTIQTFTTIYTAEFISRRSFRPLLISSIIGCTSIIPLTIFSANLNSLNSLLTSLAISSAASLLYLISSKPKF